LIDPRLLGRAVDRAILILIDAVGRTLTEDLEPFAITSATELVDARPMPQATEPPQPMGAAPWPGELEKVNVWPTCLSERVGGSGRSRAASCSHFWWERRSRFLW